VLGETFSFLKMVGKPSSCHGYDVFPDSDRTQPFGSGATCFYNYGGFVIKINTGSSLGAAILATILSTEKDTALTGVLSKMNMSSKTMR